MSKQLPNKVKVVSEVSCKNSPKRELLRDITIATVHGNVEKTLEWLEADITWDLVGLDQIQGIKSVENKLNDLLKKEILELHIYNIITHGNTGALNGKLVLNNTENIEFCHLYMFKGHTKTAKIKEITTYLVPSII